MISAQKDINKISPNEAKLELYALLDEGYKAMKEGRESSIEYNYAGSNKNLSPSFPCSVVYCYASRKFYSKEWCFQHFYNLFVPPLAAEWRQL